MKRFLLILLVIFLPCVIVYGQGLVYDAILDSILTTSHIDQVIAFGQMLADNVQMIENTVQQIEYMKTQADLALQFF